MLWTDAHSSHRRKCRKGEFGSPYSIRDYYAVDPDYGTLDDFKRLVAGAHQRGMKVIMDIVANHTAWDSVMMTHPDFYKQDARGQDHPAGAGVDRRGGLELRQPRAPRIHDRDAEILDSRAATWTASAATWPAWCRRISGSRRATELDKIKPDIMMLAEASKPELLDQRV